MDQVYCLAVNGEFACFTRPEMKVERVSYDVPTPSAVRAVFEAILWKPAIRWIPVRIDVLNPIRWTSIRRNEVGSVISTSNVETAMRRANGELGLYVEDDRQQRAGLLLRDVSYRFYARMEIMQGCNEEKPEQKYSSMFERRAQKGQCINQPYLGCREFAADFELVNGDATKPAPIDKTAELGWMLYDMDFSDLQTPKPKFFRAVMSKGTVEIPWSESMEVRG